MRGTGRLLSQNEIKKDSKTPTVQGGFHYDAKFMKKMITADTDSAKLRIINVHYLFLFSNQIINRFVKLFLKKRMAKL